MKFAVISAQDGRSTVTSVRDVLEGLGSGQDWRSATGMEVDSDVLWNSDTTFADLEVPSEGRAGAQLVDLGIPVDSSRWLTISIRPDVELPHHRTDTIDFDTILRGEVAILLDDAEMTFTPGDSVLVMGVRHGWRTGPDGALMSVANFGIQPISNDAEGRL